MGPATVGRPAAARVRAGASFAGIAVDVGNPHLACVTDADVDALDLTGPPGYDRALFPHGVNVEFVSPVPADGAGPQVRMRVHERGVGETRSCGTGTVARGGGRAARGRPGHRHGRVHTPGGRLRVTVGPGTHACCTARRCWWPPGRWPRLVGRRSPSRGNLDRHPRVDVGAC